MPRYRIALAVLIWLALLVVTPPTVNAFARELARTDAAESWATIVGNVSSFARDLTTPAQSSTDYPRQAATTGRAQVVEPARFGPFIGTWNGHGRSLTVNGDGSVEASWRIYSWCKDPGVVSPCDRIGADGVIEPGGHGVYRLLAVDGQSAVGVALETMMPIALVLGENNTLLLVWGDRVVRPSTDLRPTDGMLFCGARSPAAWCGA